MKPHFLFYYYKQVLLKCHRVQELNNREKSNSIKQCMTAYVRYNRKMQNTKMTANLIL